MAVLASSGNKATLIFSPFLGWKIHPFSSLYLLEGNRVRDSKTCGKNNSKIARSLNPFRWLVSGALINRLSSSGVIKSSDLSPIFASSIRSGGKS